MKKRILMMDGAMGTLIDSTPKEALNLFSPKLIEAIHRRYLEAGADIIKTNTFNSSSGSDDFEINVAGARLARTIADEFTAANPAQPRFVAGVMGPGIHESKFYEHAKSLVEGGVDVLLAETITSVRTAQAALAAFERLFTSTSELPVMLSVTISRDGDLLSGETVEEFWKAVSGHKLFSVGINCGFGVRHVVPFIERLSGIVPINISCHPSAGLPNASGGYDESPGEFASILGGLARQEQVQIVGGCCGTTPAHIRAIAEAVTGIPRATIDPL